MSTTHRRIEEVALNSWPAKQQLLHDGWIVRLNGGYTKRANSVNPIYGSRLPLERKIDHCEALYRAQGQPPLFRLTPLADPGLDGALAERGYRQLDPSLVLSRNLADAPVRDAPQVAMLPLERWLQAYAACSRSRDGAQAAHRALLELVSGQALYAVIHADDEPVGCGLAIAEGRYVGIFDLVIDPDHRRQGYGQRLVEGMLGWAQRLQASCAYLQVVQANGPARALYQALGFRTAYPYWYRIKR
jgi:GNAT superfamily N-acetyltransferase